MSYDKIIIFDFGSQYTLLISKTLREIGVYNEIMTPTIENLYSCEHDQHIKGYILSGGPKTVDEKDLYFLQILESEEPCEARPVLGICYGAQLIAAYQGATLSKHETREYGATKIYNDLISDNPLITHMNSLPVAYDEYGEVLEKLCLDKTSVWMSHSDTIEPENIKLDANFQVLVRSQHNDAVAVFTCNSTTGTHPFTYYGYQFHPEVTHTDYGVEWLKAFAVTICGCLPDWSPENYIETILTEIQQTVGPDEEVLLGCSGGVDSTVVACLLQKAIGNRMIGCLIDTGLLRDNEAIEVMNAFQQLGINVTCLDRSGQMFSALQGVTDPETKRKIIGREFIEAFQEFAQQHPKVTWLAQGTIYPDVVESHGKIKSHHNVGGLPEKLGLKLLEPVRLLFKDDVRQIGEFLGVPRKLLNRYPFPGPGLGIRILGEVTPPRVAMLQKADALYMKALAKLSDQSFGTDPDFEDIGLEFDSEIEGEPVWQAGAILTDAKSVGVMGDNRTYEQVVVLRAVCSVNGMTASVAGLPIEFLSKVATKIVNEVNGINRVVYDVTTKPPGTIEWE